MHTFPIHQLSSLSVPNVKKTIPICNYLPACLFCAFSFAVTVVVFAVDAFLAMRSLSTLPSGWLGAALAGRFCAKLHLIVIQTEIMIPLYGKSLNRRIRVPYV